MEAETHFSDTPLFVEVHRWDATVLLSTPRTCRVASFLCPLSTRTLRGLLFPAAPSRLRVLGGDHLKVTTQTNKHNKPFLTIPYLSVRVRVWFVLFCCFFWECENLILGDHSILNSTVFFKTQGWVGGTMFLTAWRFDPPHPSPSRREGKAPKRREGKAPNANG